jgi:hypothetical protein
MNRRQFLTRIAVLTAGAAVGIEKAAALVPIKPAEVAWDPANYQGEVQWHPVDLKPPKARTRINPAWVTAPYGMAILLHPKCVEGGRMLCSPMLYSQGDHPSASIELRPGQRFIESDIRYEQKDGALVAVPQFIEA